MTRFDYELQTRDRLKLRGEAARGAVRREEASFENALRLLRLDVQRAYYAVLLAQSNLELAESILDQTDQVIGLKRTRYEQGEMSELELTPEERRQTIYDGAAEVRRASQFGEIIIIAASNPCSDRHRREDVSADGLHIDPCAVRRAGAEPDLDYGSLRDVPQGEDGREGRLHHPQSEWETGRTKEELVNAMSEEAGEGVGVRSGIAVKIFGDDLETLRTTANEIGAVLQEVPGAADVNVQQISGLPILQIEIDRHAVARYGINIADVQRVVESAIAGTEATQVVRFQPWARDDAEAIGNLLVSAPGDQKVPLKELARIESETGPAEVSGENGRRRISVEVNVRGRGIGSFVEEARARVEQEVDVEPGHLVDWSGMYEHLESGRNRLLVVVPLAFLLIFLLLFATFHSLRQAALVFTGIPFAATGGVLSLYLRGMPLSMSAGIGFIALFGVAVLNGVVMVTFINQLREKGLDEGKR